MHGGSVRSHPRPCHPHNDRMHCARPDAMPAPRQITSAKHLERNFDNRTHLKGHDWTQARVRSSLPLCTNTYATTSPYVSSDRTHALHVRVRSCAPSSVRSHDQCQPSLRQLTRRTQRRVRSLCDQSPVSEEQRHLNSNFDTLDQMCQPPSVSPLCTCVSIFSKIFLRVLALTRI
jgi:hypothetical protein